MKTICITERHIGALRRVLEILDHPATFGCTFDVGTDITFQARIGWIVDEARNVLRWVDAALKVEGNSNFVPTQIVAIGCTIMRGAEHLATARSHTMAKRIARALNQSSVNRRGG